jgi:peptidoglycan hydrolase CwlO-like protein
MKAFKIYGVFCVLVVCSLALFGCSKKADQSKPVSEVKAEAEKMSVEKLRSTAMEYQEAIVAKKGDIEKLTAKLKDIPLAELMGEEAKGLKADIEALNESISDLQERFKVYYEALKEKGGDLSGLKI